MAPAVTPDERDAWRLQAACRGMAPSLFYPERGDDTRNAREVCEGCPVVAECRDAGIYELFGVWGATNERERRQLRRKRYGAGRPARCARCNEQFIARRNARYCGPCGEAVRAEQLDQARPAHVRTCSECGAEFTAAGSGSQTCGRECSRQRRSRVQAAVEARKRESAA